MAHGSGPERPCRFARRIGTHAYNLAGFVTGLEPGRTRRGALDFVPGRRLDDHAQIMLRFAGGARGVLWASQVATGNENESVCESTEQRAAWNGASEEPNS